MRQSTLANQNRAFLLSANQNRRFFLSSNKNLRFFLSTNQNRGPLKGVLRLENPPSSEHLPSQDLRSPADILVYRFSRVTPFKSKDHSDTISTSREKCIDGTCRNVTITRVRIYLLFVQNSPLDKCIPNFDENLTALTTFSAIRIIGGFLIPFVVLIVANSLLITIGKWTKLTKLLRILFI